MSISQTIENIRVVIGLLPTLIEAVKNIEGLFPEGGQGQMKLALVVESLKQVQEVSDDYIPIIKQVITAIVQVFNSFGVFKK